MDKVTFLKSFIEKIWNNKNIEEVRNYVYPEYTIHLDTADPWEGKTLSHKEFVERLMFSFNSFPDMNFDIQSAIEEENHVVITWILTGTNKGNIGDFPPTNKAINTSGVTIYHFRENKLCGHTQVFDRMSVFKQLGFA